MKKLKQKFFSGKNIIFLISILMFHLVLTGCFDQNFKLIQAKNTAKIDFEATFSPAIQFQSDENQYLFDGRIINKSKKELYVIEVILYLKEGKRRIQEKGPITLYEKDIPLKPGYEARFTQIIRLPITSWDGKKFEVKISKTQSKK